MQKLKLSLLIIVAVFILAACIQKKPSDPPTNIDNNSTNGENVSNGKEAPIEEDNNAEDTDVEQTIDEIALADFFLPDGSKAHYKGEGIEFAELDIEVTKLDNKYTIIDENNGGVLIRTIYQIQEERIEIISSEPIDPDQPIPNAKDLAEKKPIEVYLQKPIKVGTTFGDWSIVETDATVETPFQTFTKTIVIEMEDNDFVNRKYFVLGFGEVKRESIMKSEAEDEFIITSSLESIE